MDTNVLDLNLIVLCGRLAVEPERKVFDSGSRLVRYLITVRSDAPRKRVDVIPVTHWDPTDEIWDAEPVRSQRIRVCGAVQRRFWESPDGRRSRVEVVAGEVNIYDLEELEPVSV
jgi:single-stranded DNA-binding protein